MRIDPGKAGFCHTKAERNQIAEENRRLMQDMNGRAIKVCGPNGCD